MAGFPAMSDNVSRNKHINFGTNIRVYTAPPHEGLVVLYLSE